jgi:hypothetical protein
MYTRFGLFSASNWLILSGKRAIVLYEPIAIGSKNGGSGWI